MRLSIKREGREGDGEIDRWGERERVTLSEWTVRNLYVQMPSIYSNILNAQHTVRQTRTKIFD